MVTHNPGGIHLLVIILVSLAVYFFTPAVRPAANEARLLSAEGLLILPYTGNETTTRKRSSAHVKSYSADGDQQPGRHI